MERYFNKKPANVTPASTSTESSIPNAPRAAASRHNSAVPELIDLEKLPRDPSKRKRMADYHPNQRDQIRRKYLTWGPHQPRGFNFPYKLIGNKKKSRRRFNPEWFDQYANWIEYSEKTDKANCLCCYLFRDNVKDNHHGHDAFVVEGWDSWKKTERLVTHVGDCNSLHNRALKDCDDLLKEDQSIHEALHRQSEIEKNEHLIRLNAAIDVCRYLLQGQSFRGHDESKDSENKGNYKEMMDYTIKQNDVVAKAFKNAPDNNQLLSPKIQKDIVKCFAQEMLGSMIEEIGNGVFSLLEKALLDTITNEAIVVRFHKKNRRGKM